MSKKTDRGKILRQCRDLAENAYDEVRLLKIQAPPRLMLRARLEVLRVELGKIEGELVQAMSKAGECPERDFGGHIWLPDGSCDYCGERKR